MEEFRAWGRHLVDQTAAACRELMYQWEPAVNLDQIRDDLCNTRQGFSFVHHPANDLSDAYLQLSMRAGMASKNGLL